jgi:hypothetical protein
MSTTKKPKRLVGSRRSVFANISSDAHAKLQRHAPATHLSAAKYTGLALTFYMDLEDAFGGPLPEQIKAMLLKSMAGRKDRLEKSFQ